MAFWSRKARVSALRWRVWMLTFSALLFVVGLVNDTVEFRPRVKLG